MLEKERMNSQEHARKTKGNFLINISKELVAAVYILLFPLPHQNSPTQTRRRPFLASQDLTRYFSNQRTEIKSGQDRGAWVILLVKHPSSPQVMI